MKTVLATIALSLVCAVSFAKSVEASAAADTGGVQFVFQGDGLVPVYSGKSSTTRAEVIAELKASQARGDYVHMGDEWVPRDRFMSVQSVADVRAEARLARATAADPLMLYHN